jgi:uncharacterized membrane protein
MNGAELHLAINHLPLILPFAGVLLLVGGMIFKSEILKRATYCLFILSAITAAASFGTGEDAEEVLEKTPFFDEHLIHEHEEKAELFALLMYGLGAISLAGLWVNWKQKSFSDLISYLALALGLICLFIGTQVGTSGGEIRHTEIRGSQTIKTDSLEVE